MSHLTLDEGEPGQISDEKLASLLKRDLENGFQLDNNYKFSSVCDKKRRVKRRKGPSYRKINTYFKGTKQYWKERNRRKKILHLWMVEFRSQKEIADKLGVSVSTVKRDQRKLRRYVKGQNNRAIRIMQEERHRAFEQAVEGLSLREQFDYLSTEMERYRKILHNREYRRHSQIILIDMTQLGEYGLPKITFSPGGKGKRTLAFPYKVRLHVKAKYEDKLFLVDVGGIELTQTSGWGW